jgi:uncharacterized protein with GYD domain
MPTFILFLNRTEQGIKNAKEVAKRRQAIGMTGNARATTVRAYSIEEFTKLASEVPAV